MHIQDIMTHEVITVTETTPITEVANILHHHSFHAIPVVDMNEHIVGIITETDFFLKEEAALHLPTYIGIMQQGVDEQTLQELPQLQVLMLAQAKDIMTRHCICLPAVADIRDMITLVKMHHFKTFPVTDFTGRVVGIVSLMDIISELGKGALRKRV